MKRLLYLLSCAAGTLLLYLAWLIFVNAESAGGNLPAPKGLTDIFAAALAEFLAFYFLLLLAFAFAALGIGFIIAGITGLLNSAVIVAPDTKIRAVRLARLATIRTWISRVAWTFVLGGLGYFGVQLIRQNLGADIKFLDYFVFGGTWVMLGLIILLLSAIGGLMARVFIQRA